MVGFLSNTPYPVIKPDSKILVPIVNKKSERLHESKH